MPKSKKRIPKGGKKKTIKRGGGGSDPVLREGEYIMGDRDSENWQDNQFMTDLATSGYKYHAKPVALGLFGAAVIVVGSLLLSGVIKTH
jgi:hypothetical protein